MEGEDRRPGSTGRRRRGVLAGLLVVELGPVARQLTFSPRAQLLAGLGQQFPNKWGGDVQEWVSGRPRSGFQQSVANEETVALSQPSVSRIIFSVAEAIATVGKAKGWVKFPTDTEKVAVEKVAVKQRFLERGKLPGVVGCVDGTLIAIVRPRKMSPAETEAYWSRKGFYALNCMVVCDADLRIVAIDPRMPGSCHDSFVWRHSALRRRLTCGFLNDEFLLGDSGYPLEPWLLLLCPDTRHG
ncbi:putative nuclease HARBI1 [Dermacentor silvarum]|uniref:putative nuclease HARBI1 n=1 Tax=Dermacentor silvarum TaxID=543639 RepID=UPI002100F604|nr:putative nuclease HARBI1 [Dermacentor silvarum]